MLLDTLNKARDLGRLHEIASVLIRNGLGEAVQRLGFASVVERAGRTLRWKVASDLRKPTQVRFREALEELGPTFVKLGQILAGRSDLLPPAWTEELSRLHARARPVPYEEIREQLVEDLGAPPEEVFERFETTALAAASIAQVHRAALADGTPVVLKIRRPGTSETVEADLRLLSRLAVLIEERMPELARFRPRSLFRHFARVLKSELDLRIEAKNAQRLRANLAGTTELVVPRIHPRWTHERLCVMDYLEGPDLGEWMHGRKPGVESRRMAATGAQAVLHMVFVDGFFHADPHPGNLVRMPDGRIGLLDFGMVGFLSRERRTEFLELLLAVVSYRVDEAVDILLEWSAGDVDLDLLTQDCSAFIDRYHGVALKELDTTRLLLDLTALLRDNDLFLPHDVALLIKVFVTLDGLGRRLDPDFVMSEHLEPFTREALEKLTSPTAVVRRGAREVGQILSSLPRSLRQVLVRARHGKLHLDVDVQRLEPFGRMLDRSANRLTMGLITSALIVGTAISLTIPGGPHLFGLPLFGFIGFTSSILAGLWILWSILRSGRRS